MCRVYDEGFDANTVVDQSLNIYRDVFHFLIYSGSVVHTWLARAITEVEREAEEVTSAFPHLLKKEHLAFVWLVIYGKHCHE